MITQQQFNEAQQKFNKNQNDVSARFTINCYYVEQDNLRATQEYFPDLFEKLDQQQLIKLFESLKTLFSKKLNQGEHCYSSSISMKDLINFLSLIIKLQGHNVPGISDWLLPEKASYKTLLQWGEIIGKRGWYYSPSSIKDFYIKLSNVHKENKLGLPKNNSAAIACLIKAYNASPDGDTANQIGNLYYEQKDRKNALRYFEEGSDRNNYYASYNAGICHHYPDGNALGDLKKAESFYKKSISQVEYNKVYTAPHFYLGRLYKSTYLSEKKQQSGPAYYGRNYERILDDSKQNYKKAADNGHVPAAFELACLYQEENNLKEAEVYFKKAAGKEHKEALVKLFYLYRQQNKLSEAQAYLKQAAAEGDAEANYLLGCQYEESEDYDSAFKCFHQALLKKHEKTQVKLKNSDAVISSYYYLYQKLKSEGGNLETVLEKMEPYLELQDELDYFFKNPQYLFDALNRNITKEEAPFQKLEFLGDSILTATIRMYLVNNIPEKWTVGDVEKSSQELIANKTVLPKVAKELKLGSLIQKGQHEIKHDITDKMLSDAMESLIGAIVQDQQEKSKSLLSFEAAGKVICRLWEPYLKQALKTLPNSAQRPLAAQNQNVSMPSAVHHASSSSALPVTSVIKVQHAVTFTSLTQYNPTLFSKDAKLSTYKQSLLQKGGANCHNNGKKGDTPLMTLINQEKDKNTKAFNQDALEKMELLLSNGASWAEKNREGVSAEDAFKTLSEAMKKKIPEQLHPNYKNPRP